MSAHPFVTMDVFTDTRFGGNPLAIFPEADAIPAPAMQAIAAEFNLSETVFLLGKARLEQSVRARIFTPKVELPFAGHPLVGAALYLADGRAGVRRILLEVGAGAAPAHVQQRADGRLEAMIAAPVVPYRGPASAIAEAAAVLGLEREDIAFAPLAYSAGVPYAFIPLTSREALSRVRLERSVWSARFRSHWAPALFPFAMDSFSAGREVHGRMFAPGIGIEEDPATGSAAAALVGLQHDLQQPRDAAAAQWTLFQGADMGRSSRIGREAALNRGVLTEARIRGGAVHVAQGVLSL